MRLAARLRARGVAVIESYPGAAQDIMRIPRKRTSLADLAAGLSALGIRFEPTRAEISHDELDAVTSAVVGLFFWAGRFEALGREEEGFLIVPRLDADYHGWLRRRVVGLSGPIAAGKTTAAKALEERGFFYARFSRVLAELLRERGVRPTREALQAIGLEVHQALGQRWLCQRLAASLPKEGNIVIDGLRYPEDHSFLVERFGPAFYHIHVSADPAIRQVRHATEDHEGNSFDEISRHPVEDHVDSMPTLAHRGIENSADVAAFIRSVVDIAVP
jgi:hypothetical protein